MAIAISSEAVQEKHELMNSAFEIKEVNTEEEMEDAAVVLKVLKTRTKAVEASRKVIKEPVLELGRRIDQASKGYCKAIDEEALRISKIIGSYHAIEVAKREVARKEAEEKAKLERDRLRKEEEIRLAKIKEEQDRADALRKKGEDEEAAKIEVQAQKDKMLATKEKIKNDMQSDLGLPSSVIPFPKKVEGVKMRENWHFEVVDIFLLQLAYPDLVFLSPNTTKIRNMIKDCKDIPGLRVWSETKAIV